MDLRQIQYFICLYEEGSVTRAARRLSIVQPALSMQLARLEDDLGQKLFERNSQGMVPTAAARQMYRLFLPILQDFARAREQVMCSDGELTGHVNIGLIASITAGVLADTLSAFSARYPKVGVTIADGYSTTLSDWVTGGQIEAAVVNGVRRHGQLKVEHIIDEDLVLVTAAGHLSPPPARLTLQQVAQLGIALVLPTRNHGLRDVIDSFAHNEDVELAPVYEVDSLVTMTRLVESTQLATILPRIVVNERVEAGALQLHTVVSPRLTRQVVLVSHPRRPLSPASAAFVAILKAQILLKTQFPVPAS
ncbi:LysR family transcriptional regulator [Massilia cavernae]|uniref:LysR family transcriptional regulator n=1 Tax=Massilia cavernae TaxID=2320864 RepID=A0A418XG82_9BURK|nr:LysR family transcriptional regulator [Massilia cavernae]RJG11474.1 LysR family transcriptional regulator [Massilia cavernae]